MHLLAIPCVAMSAINAYLGAYHLLLALRRPQAREHLPFALLCLCVAAYDGFSVGLYDSTSLAQGVFWQRLQIQTVVLISMMTIWFIGRLTGSEHTRGIRLSIAWFALLVPVSLIPAGDLTVSESTPAIKDIAWGQHTITYYESDVGALFLLVIASAFIAYVYVVHVLVRHYRGKRSRHILAILIGNLAYFIGVMNDSLIAARAYASIYLSEYAFFVLTLSMAYVLMRKFVDLQFDVEALNVNLERTVVLRTAALQHSLEQQRAMQAQLVESSRRSGMADVAADVLHNVGNALNSVNVSVCLLEDTVRESRLGGLQKVVRLICDHESDLSGFFAHDARAKRLPAYLTASTTRLEEDRVALARELESLRTHVDHIKVVVATQEAHTGAPVVNERASLAAILDEAMRERVASFGDHGIKLERDYAVMPEVNIDRHKLLQVISNLLDNAWDAVEGATAEDKRIRIRLRALAGNRAAIDVEDSGCGILPEHLTQIFNHGFTTRSERHGFGLHASGCAAGELGGTLTAASDGPGRGARFTLTLPLGGTAADPPDP